MMRTTVIAILIFWGAQLQAFQGFGALKGSVVDENGSELSKAVIAIEGMASEYLTDSQGIFYIKGVPTGSRKLTVSYIGHIDATLTVEIKAGLNLMEPITIKPVPVTEYEILVRGSLREGQAKALNEQRLSSNIKNIIAADQIGTFPDSNAAEATQRVPGVNIARDQGEGRYVLIRGTESRLNHTVIDGLDVPAPEGDLRTVALDVVPLDMLEGIEITKAITPDMDGDAVGGSVNLKVRQAPNRQTFSVGVEGGYNDLAEDTIQAGNFLWGNRFNDGKFGVIASFSYDETDRASDNFEVAYDDGLPEEFEQRDYTITRERVGAHLSTDFKPNERMTFKFTSSYSEFDDQEFRRRLTHVPGDGELERELKDRFETQSIITAKFEADILTPANLGRLNFRVGHSYARESEPGRLDTTFKAEDVAFAPNYSEGNFDGYNIQPNPAATPNSAFELDDIAIENNFTNDEHNQVAFSYEFPSVFGDTLAKWKVGGKYRVKEKMRDVNVEKFEADDVLLAGNVDTEFDDHSYLGGQWQMGDYVDPQAARNILANAPGETEFDFEEESADYEVEETKTALFAMATFELGENWEFLPGLRWEEIDAEYVGTEVTFDSEGDFASLVKTPGENKDDILMPMLHGRYMFSANTQLRAAVTRTYARARVFDQVPFRFINEEDSEIEQGNPEIDITKVWNYDLMFEHYYGDQGLFSLGLFRKDLTDYIYIFNEDGVFNGEDFEFTTPLNGPDAELNGVEIAFQKIFTGLPDPFNGFGVYANFTYTDSEATFPERANTSLPGQSEETGNLALIYERGGFSLRLSGNLHGKYIDEIGDEPAEDIWVDDHFQVDMTASYRRDNWRVFLELVNLNDEPLVLYEGTEATPIQFEEYSFWGRLGFKYDF
jgi:TonB-dependent receptor